MELAAAVGNSIRTARGAHRTLCFVHARWQSMSGRNTRDKWTCVTDWQEQLHLHAVLCQCAVRGEDDPSLGNKCRLLRPAGSIIPDSCD
jgi:hypothetical protein